MNARAAITAVATNFRITFASVIVTLPHSPALRCRPIPSKLWPRHGELEDLPTDVGGQPGATQSDPHGESTTQVNLRVLQRLECEIPVLEESRFAGINLRTSAWEVRQRPHAIRQALRVMGEVCDRNKILQA